MTTSTYRGRFAPSPTGPLHFGSLLTAVASYLDAKAHFGQWLIRIEDVDTSRAVPGASQQILEALTLHGLHSDEPIVYQSQRYSLYEQALQALTGIDRTFKCLCTRKALEPYKQQHPLKCVIPFEEQAGRLPHSTRFIPAPLSVSSFHDRLQGHQSLTDYDQEGPFVLKRRDQLFSYQLAVTIDDAAQKITDVVRGLDIMDSTPKQIALQEALALQSPRYLHLPLVCNAHAQKLSKQNRAKAIDIQTPQQNLLRVFKWLNISISSHQPPELLPPEALLQCAIEHWRPSKLPKHRIPGAYT